MAEGSGATIVDDTHAFGDLKLTIGHWETGTVLELVSAAAKLSKKPTFREKAQPDGEKDMTGLQAWPLGPILAEFLALRLALLQPRSVLELGAGGGLLGITCKAVLGENVAVTLTDYSRRALELMTRNLSVNGLGGSVEVKGLAWTEDGGEWIKEEADLETDAHYAVDGSTSFDLVVGSELLYHFTCEKSLIATSCHLLDTCRGVLIQVFHSRVPGTIRLLQEQLDLRKLSHRFYDLDSLLEVLGSDLSEQAIMSGSYFLMAAHEEATLSSLAFLSFTEGLRELSVVLEAEEQLANAVPEDPLLGMDTTSLF